ncbi:MAG: hypothetical protein MH321_01250 [Leptospiraceae bacterium]|nr:hypothetical protein [Leptospiraceae bacterium]
MVTLSKIISNGKIDGKNSEGEYKSGTQVESRNIALARVAPVVAPKGKDLFDQWTDDDWQDVDQQKEQVFSKFVDTLDQTSKMLAQNTAVISSIESKNEKLFQERKKAQEEADSFLKDMVLAYVTGGMAGIKSAIRGKIEDKINMELAKAFIQATGGSPDQVQLFSDAIGFMKGKMKERRIKAQANDFSVDFSNPLNILAAPYAIGAKFIEKAGPKLISGISSIPIVGNVIQMSTALTLSATRAIAGPKAYDGMMNKATGAKRQLAEIKANEKALTKSYVTRAVAHTTGLPGEVVGQMITDYQGAKAAKKVRRAVAANPVMNVASQVVGVVGGIVKTAAVAFGAKERDMQRFLNDANSLQFAGSLNYNAAEIQNNAYTNQMLGMKAQGTSYSSNIPTLKNKKGFVEELGKRMLVERVAEAGGWDKDIVNAAIRGELSRREQKKADKKAQADAARSTAITAITTVGDFI